MKKQLEKFKELYKFFYKKAEEIAILKHKYRYNSYYDYSEVEYDYEENIWYVKLITTRRCEDDYEYFSITENELLSELSDLEVIFKVEKEKKDAENARLKIEQEEKEKLEKEKRELALYESLKKKYEK